MPFTVPINPFHKEPQNIVATDFFSSGRVGQKIPNHFSLFFAFRRAPIAEAFL